MFAPRKGGVRRNPRNLQKTRLSDQYVSDLDAAYCLVTSFIVRIGNELVDLDVPAVANEHLINYIQAEHESPSGSLRNARYAILAFQTRHRSLKGQLRSAWDSVQSWQLERTELERTASHRLSLIHI